MTLSMASRVDRHPDLEQRMPDERAVQFVGFDRREVCRRGQRGELLLEPLLRGQPLRAGQPTTVRVSASGLNGWYASLSASMRAWNRWCSRLASIRVKPRNDSRSGSGSSSAHIETTSVLRNGMKCSPLLRTSATVSPPDVTGRE